MGFSGGGGGGLNGVTVSGTPSIGQILEALSTSTAGWVTGGGGPPTGAAGGDLSGTYPSPVVAKVNGAALPLGLVNGGTGQGNAQAAINALLGGVVTAGNYPRGNGTNVVMASIQVGDVPTLNQSTTGNAGTATNLAGGATLPAFLAPNVSALAFVGAGTTLVNAALANAFNLTLTASTTTLGNPSNPVDGQVIRFRISQDATGGRTLAYGTAYDFGAAGAPTLSTAANAVDILGFEYVASISKWCYLGSGLGF